MAFVTGEYFKKGCFFDVQYYYDEEGRRCARMKSTLEGKKVKKHKAFARTRVSYKRLAKASPIASKVYRQLPAIMHIDGFFDHLTGAAIHLIKQGYTEKQVYDILLQAATSEQCKNACTIEEDAYAIAAKIYWQLPAARRMDAYLYAMTGEVIKMLQQGFSKQQAHDILYEAVMPKKVSASKPRSVAGQHFAETILEQVFNNERELTTHHLPLIVASMPP